MPNCCEVAITTSGKSVSSPLALELPLKIFVATQMDYMVRFLYWTPSSEISISGYVPA